MDERMQERSCIKKESARATEESVGVEEASLFESSNGSDSYTSAGEEVVSHQRLKEGQAKPGIFRAASSVRAVKIRC